MFKRQSFLSNGATRSAVLAIAGVLFLTIAAGATSAAGFSIVDSLKGFFGLSTGAPSTGPARSPSPGDRPVDQLLTEDFSYTVGSTINGTGGWNAHSGAGTNPITVTAPGLTFPGYPSAGNAVTVGPTGEDDNDPFTSTTAGTVYAAFLVNVTASTTTGDYFFHYMVNSGDTLNFAGKVFVKKDATTTNYAFGISKRANAGTGAVFTGFTYAPNATHLLVVKYTFNPAATDDTLDLFIDPTPGSPEPAATLSATDTTAADLTAVGAVALRQGGASSGPTQQVDGIRVGTTWADVTGGGGTPNPTPTPTPGLPTPTPSPTPTPTPAASPSPTVPPVPFTAGNLALYRVGYGPDALSSAAAVVFLDEYTPAGAYVQSIRMPIAPNGANHILTASGTSAAEGMLTRSVDGDGLVLTGYDKVPGGSNPSADPPTATNRVIGRVNANAGVDTSTALTDPTSNIRGVATTDGSNLWLTASGNGSRYTMAGMTTSTQLATTPTNLRATEIYSGQLYVSSATGTFLGISTVGTGLPTTGGQTITLLNGFPTTGTSSPYQFAFFNANTLYVADDRAIASGGGVQKWTQSGGTWTLVNTFNNGLTSGCRGLTLTTNGSNQPVIYASTADSLSKFVSVTDDGTAMPLFTTLATTGANTAWRGVAFVPSGGGGATPTPGITPTPSPTRTPTPTPPATPTPTPSGVHTAFDFDGDHKTDISVWRPSLGQWWLDRSTAGILGLSFGVSTDIPRAADYTGDGKTDVAFFRPSDTNWYVLRSEDFTYFAFPWGASGDTPVTGDFDGDGKADAAVYRPSAQTWFILKSTGGVLSIPFGLSGDIPVPADYDGDGKTDVAIYRPNVGQWWYLRSSNGSVFAASFGSSTDKPVPGDYTGDHKADIAFFRPSEANWYVLRSEDFTYYAFPWGAGTDKPAPGDYDGDGKFDAAMFRPSDTVWYILKSSGGTQFTQFGLANDIPVPGQSIP